MADEIRIRRLDRENTLVVRVQITREFRFRLWLGLRLIALGAAIIGLGFRLDPDGDGEPVIEWDKPGRAA